MEAELREGDRDAVMMWLRHGGTNAVQRQRMATTIMRGSVAAQAVLAGVLSCGYCWDEGCDLCSPEYAWTRQVDSMRVAFYER